MIDVLDASGEAEGVILLNVAPRHGKAKRWPNGTPFAYFHVGKTLVVASIDGLSLTLLKKLKLIESIHLMDIPTVLDSLVTDKVVTSELRDHIVHTQFRSFEFVPRVAKWLLEGQTIPSTEYSLDEVADAPQAVWCVDNFGNCKTTLLPEEIDFKAGKKLKTHFGEIACFSRLKDVPNDMPALIIGSSGINSHRFIEIVIQGKSAAKAYEITPGTEIF